MDEIVVKDPPPRRMETQRRDWALIVLRISEEAPGVWVLAARDVGSSTANHLRRTFGVEVRTAGRDQRTGRAAELYVRFDPEKSNLNDRAMRIKEQRERAVAARARLKAKEKKK